MNLKGVYLGVATSLAGCSGAIDSGIDAFLSPNSFLLDEITAPEFIENGNLQQKYLAAAVLTMQGDVGQYLLEEARQNNVRIGYASDLDHAHGTFFRRQNKIFINVPEDLTEENLFQHAFAARFVLYHELDHAARNRDDFFPEDIALEDKIDGIATVNEAIANLTALIGLSQDAEIFPGLTLIDQVSFSFDTIPISMANAMYELDTRPLPFHEDPEAQLEVFKSFFNTSYAALNVLRYSASVVPDNAASTYPESFSVSDVLNSIATGRDVEFEDMSNVLELYGVSQQLPQAELRAFFEAGGMTSEAERIPVVDYRFVQSP